MAAIGAFHHRNLHFHFPHKHFPHLLSRLRRSQAIMQASPLVHPFTQLRELAGTPLPLPTRDQIGPSTPTPSKWFTTPPPASHHRHNPDSPITPSISPLTPLYEPFVTRNSSPSPGPWRFRSAAYFLSLWMPGRQRFLDPVDNASKSVEPEADPLVAIEVAAAQSRSCIRRLTSDLVQSEDDVRKKDGQSKSFLFQLLSCAFSPPLFVRSFPFQSASCTQSSLD